MKILKKIGIFTLSSILLMSFVACQSSGSGDGGLMGMITSSGSSALLPLAQDAVESFKEKNPDVSVTLNAGGSGTGLKQVVDGSVDVGNSDVPAEDKLEPELASKLKEYRVCVAVIAPIINQEMAKKVKNLTKEQLIGIFTGEITNWKEVGGDDEEILLIARPRTSGTRAIFREYALDGREEFSGSALETDDSGTLLKTIAENKGAIGYISLSYLMNKNTVSTVSIDGVEPTLENTYAGKYPVWGYEYMYTKGEPEGVVKAYLDHIMSEEYSIQIEKQGYGVTSKMKVER